MRVEDHEEHNSDRPSPVVVLRVPKTAVPRLFPDEVGTRDAKSPSFYTDQVIPKEFVEILP